VTNIPKLLMEIKAVVRTAGPTIKGINSHKYRNEQEKKGF